MEDDAEVWFVPTSQRFINQDTNDKVRDPGAQAGITGLDANYKSVVMNAHAKLFFNQKNACDFIDRHGKRNVPASEYGKDDTESYQKMGWNVRGDATQPWFIWFNENITAAMQSQGEPLLTRYDWAYYELKYPVNADLDGVVKCKSGEKTCEPGLTAMDTLEPIYGDLLSKELDKQIGEGDKGGSYFCGPGYDPKTPDVCPSIQIEIPSISLVDKAPLQARQKLVNLREQAENDKREASLTTAATEAAVAAQEAKLDQAKQLQDVIDSFGGVDPGVAEAERNAALDRAKAAGLADVAAENARAAAAEKMAPCTIVGAKGDECARILAALNGNYPQGNGTSVQVNPGN